MTNYLVTGGAGFIGSNLTEALLGRGHRVRVLDNLSTGRLSNLSNMNHEIEFVEGDLRDHEIVRKAVEEVEIVLHQAALPSVSRSINAPLTSNDVNVGGTLNLLVASRNAGVRRIVYASSSSIYGNTAILPKCEDLPSVPRSPYAVSKMAAEAYCQAFFVVYGLETVCLRYFNVFGPRQDPSSEYAAVIPRFINLALQHQPIPVHGDGEQSRDFTFVENVVQANLLAAEVAGVAGQTFNVACGARHTLSNLIESLEHILGISIERKFMPSRIGDVKHSLADISKARKMLGYVVQVPFEPGLERTVAWYRTRSDQLDGA